MRIDERYYVSPRPSRERVNGLAAAAGQAKSVGACASRRENDSGILQAPNSPPPETRLDEIAGRIKARDEQARRLPHARWMETGAELLEAKSLIGHGGFEDWCRDSLSYSKRKAEKLMRAADVFGAAFENRQSSDLPPISVIYALSSKAVPTDVRKGFIERFKSGDRKGAIASAKADLDALKAGAEGEATDEEKAGARSQMAALLRARLADQLPAFFSLKERAGRLDDNFWREVRGAEGSVQAMASLGDGFVPPDAAPPITYPHGDRATPPPHAQR